MDGEEPRTIPQEEQEQVGRGQEGEGGGEEVGEEKPYQLNIRQQEV